jgi:polysaccharide pyruvyl transferase CsaB
MRAVLCGYYGQGNGGDEALLATLLQLLPAQIQPIVLSGQPEQTQAWYGVEAVPRKSFPAVWSALGRGDVFIWGGGSLMQDATSALSPVYYAGLMGLAQGLGLKTIAWAQGIGPLRRSTTRTLARRALSGCTAVSVRDRASAALLHQWHIPCILAPDPVWALAAKPVPGFWNSPAPRIAVALRRHPHLTPERLTALTHALDLLQQATQTHLVLIPFQPVADLAIAEGIHHALPRVSTVLTLSDPQQLKWVFQGVEMTIGMRYHALIMAAAAECRCFALSYDPKVEQLMDELAMPGWDLPDIPTDAGAIAQRWIETYANGDALSSTQVQAMVDRALLHRDLLHGALATGDDTAAPHSPS